MSAGDSIIAELREVEMQFEEKKVLNGLSLSVRPQDRLVIMGQSGSGKSTILRLILGILEPNSGSISSSSSKSPACADANCRRCAERSEWFINTRRCSAHAPCETTLRYHLRN